MPKTRNERKPLTKSIQSKGGGLSTYLVTTAPSEGEAVADVLKRFKEAVQKDSKIKDVFDHEYKTPGEATAKNKENKILRPIIPLSFLADLPYKNSLILQCVDVYKKNIDSLGHYWEEYNPHGEEWDDEQKKEAEEEKKRLECLIVRPNSEYSNIELRQRLRDEREKIGHGYIEVQREYDPETKQNNIVGFRHAPAKNIRITMRDKKPTSVTYTIEKDGTEEEITELRRFKRYVQKIHKNIVYFKEFGDPRVIDCRTGLETKKELDAKYVATEIKEVSEYNSISPYGLPRYINQLPSILGSREAEELNYRFFENDGVPYLVVSVSGGSLDDNSVQNVKEQFNAFNTKQGHQVLVLQANSERIESETDVKVVNPTIDVKPLTDSKIKDGQFLDYDERCLQKLLSCYRLSKLLIGLEGGINRATAFAAMDVAESQVFQPERNEIDEIYNYCLLVDAEGNPPKYWRYRSNGLKLIDKENMIKAFNVVRNTGAITPNVAREFFNEVFGWDIKKVDSPWGDYPFEMTMELVKSGKYIPKDLLEALEQVEENVEGLTTETNEDDV